MNDIGILKFGRFKEQFKVGENIFVRIVDSGIIFTFVGHCFNLLIPLRHTDEFQIPAQEDLA